MNIALHLQTGKKAEELACKYLQKKGLLLLEKNFRCRLGEIDLIMQEQDFLVFVEVRFRQNLKFGDAVETVNFNKQQRIINTANYYLQVKKLYDRMACRFDVMTLKAMPPKTSVNWIKNAFTL